MGILWIAVTCLMASCATTPQPPPELIESVSPLDGIFVGTASVTESASSSARKSTRADVAITFVEGEYTVTGDGEAVQSSAGSYFMGHRLLLQQRTSEFGAASERVLQGYFDYNWGTGLLVLEQWDARRDRLVQVILERTSSAHALFPYTTPDASTKAQPWPPRRYDRHLPLGMRTASDQ